MKVKETYLMLGVDHEGNGQVAIVLGTDLEASKNAFSKRFPGITVISWPSYTDLKRSVAIMELARQNPKHADITCEIILA